MQAMISPPRSERQTCRAARLAVAVALALATAACNQQGQALTDGLPLNLRGTLWLRFTLAPVQPGLEPPFLRLDLGRGVPSGSELYLPDGNLNAELSTWIPQPPLEKNIFLLQFSTFSQQAQAPVTAYVKIPGTVGLWFSPQLLTTQPTSLKEMSGVSILDMLAAFWSWLLSPSSSLAYIVLGLLTAWCLSRAFKRGGEWRLWTAVFSALALLQGMVPMPYSRYSGAYSRSTRSRCCRLYCGGCDGS